MNFDNRTKAIIATLGAQVIWGIAGPLVKVVLGSVPPFGLMFLRFLGASIILFIIYELKLAKTQPEMTREDKKNIFLAGFFGVFVNIALYFWGQQLTTVIDAWVITSAGTLFVIILSYFFLKEHLTKVVYLGAAISFIGTIIVLGDGIFQFGRGGLLGNLAILGATLSAAISYLLTKKLVEKFSPLVLTYYFFLTSLVFSLPLFLLEYFQNPTWLSSLSSQSLLIIGYLILGSSIGAYYLSNLGLKHLSASLAATIGYSSVVIAIGLSIIFLHEKPTEFFIIGTSLIAIGLFLAETRHPSHPIHKLQRK